MKHFTRIEPTEIQQYGDRYKRVATIKHFRTEDGMEHEFTVDGAEGDRIGVVIALTPDKKVITSYQFRAGPERYMYELPGGMLHVGEDPQLAAVRELQEETGYVPGAIELVGTSSGDGYTNFVWYYYLATDCHLSQDGQTLDAEEDAQGLEVRLISIDDLIDNAKHDQMTDAHAVLMAYDQLMQLKEKTS